MPSCRPQLARLALALYLGLPTAIGCSPARPSAPIYSSGTGLIDQQGRTVVLRGVNLRAAGFFDANRSLLPLPPFTADDCRVLGDELGMSQIRLAVNWSSLEPTQGSFDDGFVSRILQIAGDCAQYGVYTLVDLHQDAWSKYVGADGAPFWAHDPSLPPSAIDESAGNQPTTSGTVQAAFRGFFENRSQLMNAYASMASHLARLIDKQPGIIGLEIMNEPFATDEDLKGFYALVAPGVRAAAPGLPIYFEPTALRNLFDFASPNPLTVDNAVYAPHLYTGIFQGNWMIGQTSRIEDSITNMLSEAKGAHAALMVTEFGANPVDPVGAAWLTAALDLLDHYVVSASLWVYEEWPSTCGVPVCWGFYDETATSGQAGYTRTLRPAAVTLLARAWPRAVAGRIDSFEYDAASRTLTVHIHSSGGTHVLAAPTRVYPSDVVVTCDGRTVPSRRQGSRVEVQCAGSTLVMAPAPMQ
jgi:endoglycosylceramidase